MSGQGAPGSGYADVHGARLYYETMGAGHPLVLVHAGIADSRMWDDQFAVFAAHYRVIRYDIRGFGKSAMPPGPSSTSGDLYGLLMALGVAKAYIVGLSIGGGIAIDFTLQHPEMVSALVAVASGLGGTQPSAEMQRVDEEIDAVRAHDGIDATVEAENRLWVDGPKRTPDQVNPSVRARVGEMNGALHRLPEVDALRERLDPPAVERLGEIHAPTLVIVGDGDVPDVIETADVLARGIAGAQKIVVPGVAHMVNMEVPDAFNRAVLDFLRQH
ncbi:MAG: alpha/beta fold hydrolase [Chloroflexota bacterium]|nr:alpha/beta fold hydrolase [Chloroflexota bacterium]